MTKQTKAPQKAPEAPEAAVEELAALSIRELADRFRIEPQTDPHSDREFFLWDNMFTRTEDGLPLPNYTVQETAKVFFGKGSDWLRWRYRPATHFPDGYFVLDGVVLRPKRTESGNRYYTLADIERMAHALVENNAIDGEHLLIIIHMLLLQARLHRVIREPEA